MTDWMECWGKARERVVKATFVGAGKEGLCPQMQNPRLRRGIFICQYALSRDMGKDKNSVCKQTLFFNRATQAKELREKPF